MERVVDVYGRSFKTLRVSLLNSCNLGCVYCTMGDNEIKENNTKQKSHYTADDFANTIQQLHNVLDLRVIRLTGGEPLLYPQLVSLVQKIQNLGIPEIKLTTNGFLLKRLAIPLKEAGMQSINVSLDAVDENVFFLMSRRHQVQRVIDGIDEAIKAGLEVKINTVLMKGMNDQEVLPLLNFAFERGIAIRFLEVMAMGHLYKNAHRFLVTKDEILHHIAHHFDFMPLVRNESATANYWKTTEGGVFGIIANESTPFCHDCNRLRLDSNGNIYGCLSEEHPISLKGIHSSKVIEEKLRQALRQKQTVKFSGSALSMLNIGG